MASSLTSCWAVGVARRYGSGTALERFSPGDYRTVTAPLQRLRRRLRLDAGCCNQDARVPTSKLTAQLRQLNESTPRSPVTGGLGRHHGADIAGSGAGVSFITRTFPSAGVFPRAQSARGRCGCRSLSRPRSALCGAQESATTGCSLVSSSVLSFGHRQRAPSGDAASVHLPVPADQTFMTTDITGPVEPMFR